MIKRDRGPTRVEMLKAQVLLTAHGTPADLDLVEDCYGKAFPAPEPGWFWIGATPNSAADIRRRGLRTRGTVTSTFIPPQEPPPSIPYVDPATVPLVGTQAHTYLMLEEKEARESREGSMS